MRVRDAGGPSLVCCLSDRDRQALTDLVTPLGYHPIRMAVDQRRAVVAEGWARRVCRYCGKPRITCVGGCDLAPAMIRRVHGEVIRP